MTGLGSNALSRRTTLGVLASLFTASGCSASGAEERARKAVKPLQAPVSTPPAPVATDRPLVDRVVAALQAAEVGAPAPFVALHQAHVKALGGQPAASPSAATTTAGTWHQRQKTLVDTLTDAGVAAQDPQLVTLLAACVAAQRQLLRARGVR